MMKKIFLTSAGMLVCSALSSAPAAPTFGGERIGVPPLSLTDAITKPAQMPKSFQFGNGLPTYSSGGNPPNFSPHLVPKFAPSLDRRDASRPARSPRISRDFGMPLFEPSAAVDYKLTIVPPDRSIDFKMIVKDPVSKAQPEPAK